MKAGKMVHQKYKDPFNAGQMVGMLVVLTSIEKNGGITQEVIDRLKFAAADNVQEYFNKPTEDIFLMVDRLVQEINL